MDRRKVLRLLAGATLIPIFGCGESATGSDGGGGDMARGAEAGGGGDLATMQGTCSTIADETGGPYPGDGSNGPNALATNGIVRSDIRASFGGMNGTAAGIPLTIKLTLVNTAASCAALAGYAIYLWHCDRDGKYSLYTIAGENYLRGVQATDAGGVATFTSIFPACYSGRWPHIHFEIFQSVASATSGGARLKTSQLALPEASCNEVYATNGYSASVTNLRGVTLASDMVFSDGSSKQLAAVTGDVNAGYVATLTVGIAA